ncbi:Uncharacterized protein FWK35_00017665 [Aphis craccivora]|uniref:Uncharacterized protein n=1 Tax=Aphis craccivora TaxID=307492 RepID=A0A6G0Y6U4_APHCR|nr:Uncharacterized protein FWK35_00017665 [Aphis craccivora]
MQFSDSLGCASIQRKTGMDSEGGGARCNICKDESKRSDVCIDFTMLCVFLFILFIFLYLCTREPVEIMLQFQTMGVVSDGKMNLVGALGRSFFEIPNSFQKHREKPKKKIKKKRKSLRKTSF